MPDNLSIGTITPISVDIDISGGGSSATIPQATTTDAGLMTAADKTKVDEILTTTGIKNATNGNNSQIVMANGGTYITRNVADGNVALVVIQNAGSTGYPQFWQKGANMIAAISIGGYFTGPGIQSITGTNNSLITTSSNGTVISRNVGDANPSLVVNQANVSSPGNIQTWQNGGTQVAQVNAVGLATFKRIGANPNSTIAPAYLLDVNAGSAASASILASFQQNNGFVRIENATNTANHFLPVIKSVSVNRTDAGLIMTTQGANSYTDAAFRFIVNNAAGTGPITGGNTFQLENSGTSQLIVNHAGDVNIKSLAGIGTRMVTTDNNGNLSATSEVTSGTYTPTILASSGGTFTASGFTYTKINDIVTVNGRIDGNLTATGQNSMIIDLPYPITVGNIGDINGTVSGTNVSGATTSNEGAIVTAYFGLNGAEINFFAVDNTVAVCATFTYKV